MQKEEKLAFCTLTRLLFRSRACRCHFLRPTLSICIVYFCRCPLYPHTGIVCEAAKAGVKRALGMRYSSRQTDIAAAAQMQLCIVVVLHSLRHSRHMHCVFLDIVIGRNSDALPAAAVSQQVASASSSSLIHSDKLCVQQGLLHD